MTTAALALIPAPAAVGELARLADAVAQGLGLEPSMLTVDLAELAGDRYFALYRNGTADEQPNAKTKPKRRSTSKRASSKRSPSRSAPPTKAASAAKQYECPECGDDEFDSPQALGARRRHAHPRGPDGRRQVAAFDADAARARSVEGVDPPVGPRR